MISFKSGNCAPLHRLFLRATSGLICQGMANRGGRLHQWLSVRLRRWRLGQVCTHTPCCSSMTALCCDEGAKEQEKGCNSGVTHFGSLVVTVGLFSEVLDRRSSRWRIEWASLVWRNRFWRDSRSGTGASLKEVAGRTVYFLSKQSYGEDKEGYIRAFWVSRKV